MLTSLLLCAAMSQEPIPEAISSKLDRVTVYSGQALVERTFTVASDEPGRRPVVVGPLPAGADVSSFQIKVEEGPAVVQGMEIRSKTGALDSSERDRIRSRIEGLKVDLRRLEADKAKIDSGVSLVEAAISNVSSAKAMTPEALEMLFDFVESRSRLLDLARADYEASRNKLSQEIKKLEQQLGGRGRSERPFLEAGASLFFELAGTARLRLTYIVRGASWAPAYDVRVAPDLTGVIVGLVAELSQATDEDWTDAELLLSTSRPSVGLDPPDLPRRTVTLPAPPAPATPGAPKSDAMLPVLQEAEFSGEEWDRSVGFGGGGGGKYGSRAGRRVAAPEVAVQDFGLTTQFLLPERKSVKADGQVHRFTIRDVPLDVRPERYVVPSRSDKAYLRAEVRLGGETPLLAGPARVFLGPDFLGKSSFPVLRPGDKTMLHLGIDPNLTVEYETVQDNDREDPGFLSDTVHLTNIFRARVKLSASAQGVVEILIEEAIPVSDDDRVEVSLLSVQPAALIGEEDLLDREEKGIMRWRISLPPAAEQAIHWGWKVSFDEELQPIFGEN